MAPSLSVPEILVPLSGAILCAAWVLIGTLVLKGSRQMQVLKDALPERTGEDIPALSVVVTARDEAEGIETTVRRLLAQRYPDFEVIVVDDRSTDGTSEILDRLAGGARGAARLVILHNRALPEGWLGKCHACRLGADRARGRWILFTDGDVALVGDDLLARVVSHAEQQRLDHLAALPDLRPMPPVQTGIVSAFGEMYVLGGRLFEMDRDLPRGGAGVGAFNLVRRSAYDKVGGHHRLKMDLADDFKLGRLLKESGARQRLFLGRDLIRCAWHRGTLPVIRGLEKNFFAGFDYSLIQLAVFTLAVLLTSFGPAGAALLATRLAAGSPGSALYLALAWLPPIVQVVFLAIGYAREGRRHGYNPLVPALLQPISVLLLLGAAWNSALRTLARGGVRWRDTFYPLDVLRGGLVPPGAGRRPEGTR